MKPLRLKMQAFGSYGKETVIDFEKVNQNLFLITGDTGAGKTTIFDAIVFALYGEASSSTNKKDGVVLQSQYVDFAQEPFVELVFAEGQGETREVYTVRRVPRHLKTITRGAAKGKQREVTGSVSLIMPDGTEYPSKETDRKLQEITGLTKGQFMQVAMIAQGEFMELLRARSDDKKVIFRKLFNTEMYQEIVAELGNRKRAKEKEIAVLKTQCQSEVSRIRIPEIYGSEILKQLKKQLEEGEMTRLTDFLKELEILCDWLGKHTHEAEKEYQESGKKRDEKRDAFTKAESLLSLFQQLEAAEEKLKIYQGQQSEIDTKISLITQIKNAYEIQEKYIRFMDAEKIVTTYEKSLNEQQEQLPACITKLKKAEKAAEEMRIVRDQELQNYTKVAEKVERAHKIFDDIQTSEGFAGVYEAAVEMVRGRIASEKKELENLEQQQKSWKVQSEKLAEADKKLLLAETRKQEEEKLEQEVQSVIELRDQAETCRKRTLECRNTYIKTRDKYLRINEEYEYKRQLFLDAQAGFLAEKLEAGKPCPVCGSTEHPHPREKSGEYVDISEEKLRKMGEDVDKLREMQETAAGNVQASKAEFDTRKDMYMNMVRNLQEHVCKNIPSVSEEAGLSEIKTALTEWRKELEAEVKKCQSEVEKMVEIRENLKNAEEREQYLRKSLEENLEKEKEFVKYQTESEARIKNLRSSVEFKSEEEAKIILTEAEKRRDQAEKSYKNANAETDSAAGAKRYAEALIQRYTEEIPGQKEQLQQKQMDYHKILAAKEMSEELWQRVTETYSRETVEKFQNTVNSYKENLAAAQAQKEAAQAAIGTEKFPVMDTIYAEKEEAERKYQEAKTAYDQLRIDNKDDREVFDALSSRLEERKAVVEEHARIDALYRMTSGNVSGARMDLETYVQRYYLERILYAANRRFQEMSAGQFEFRMYDLEKAGEGKNRGLDLMVYSTVTGKEREVRTLSGGESFMAALSLALGMADQIQESSAAVNLDMMFIDEGFGSLDEHSRNQAVKVLQEMAEGSRLIGIISHVTELKQEIEDQLIVNKDENGSRVRWQIS